jgi:hypothetical protein
MFSGWMTEILFVMKLRLEQKNELAAARENGNTWKTKNWVNA